MKKIFFLLPVFLLMSCEVERIPNFFIMNPPLGLTVIANPANPAEFRIEFESFNQETYFNGFAVYISPIIDNLTNINTTMLSTTDPRDFNTGALLFQLNSNALNQSTSSLSQSEPTKVFYPSESTFISEVVNFNPDGTVNNIPLPPQFFIVVYAYSASGNILSLPSNIVQFPTP